MRAESLGYDLAYRPTLAVFDAPRVQASLAVTGPVSIKRAMMRGVNLDEAVEVAGGRTAAAGMRHALTGGRQTIIHSVADDHAARGWRRVASGKACEFCSMLAGRGAVYGPDTGHFAAHDGCSCTAEPVYEDR